MTRTYGDEKIRVTFSIDDLNNVDEDADQMQDENAMPDDMDDPSDMPTDTQSGGANTKGSVNQGRSRGGNMKVAPEDSIAPADRPELADEEGAQDESEQEPSFPSHCYITVERPNKGALQIEAVAQDGMMIIENVFFYKDAKLVDPKNRGDEESARDLYTGPPFGNLDEDLQLLFERYLEERGINTTLALFVPEYIDFKEQREYLSWLNGESFLIWSCSHDANKLCQASRASSSNCNGFHYSGRFGSPNVIATRARPSFGLYHIPLYCTKVITISLDYV